MEDALKLPSFGKWKAHWKAEIDKLVGEAALYREDEWADEPMERLKLVSDADTEEWLNGKPTDTSVLVWAKTGMYDRGRPLSYAEAVQSKAQDELIQWIWDHNREYLQMAGCQVVGNVWDYLALHRIDVFKPYLCDIVDEYTAADFLRVRKEISVSEHTRKESK